MGVQHHTALLWILFTEKTPTRHRANVWIKHQDLGKKPHAILFNLWQYFLIFEYPVQIIWDRMRSYQIMRSYDIENLWSEWLYRLCLRINSSFKKQYPWRTPCFARRSPSVVFCCSFAFWETSDVLLLWTIENTMAQMTMCSKPFFTRIASL